MDNRRRSVWWADPLRRSFVGVSPANEAVNADCLYYVIDGKRRQFAAANFKVTSGEWHELRVECVGNKIICYYDGAKKIEATDDTFKDGGKIGLWTKADSVTYFDDLKVTAR